jgi:hypothetical protein
MLNCATFNVNRIAARLALATALGVALMPSFAGVTGAVTKANPSKSIASKYTKTTKANAQAATPAPPVAPKYTKGTIASKSSNLPSVTTTSAIPVLNTSISAVTTTAVLSLTVAQGSTNLASTPGPTTIAIVFQGAVNTPSASILPTSFTLDENSPGLIWCGTSNDPNADPRRGSIVGAIGSCPAGTFRLPARRAVTCYRENGSWKESFSVGPGQTCQSLAFQGECADDSCSNANIVFITARTNSSTVVMQVPVVTYPTVNPAPVSTKAATQPVVTIPAALPPVTQPPAVTYPTTRPTLAVTTTTISLQSRKARCVLLRGQIAYEVAEQQRLKTVVIPAAYARQVAAIVGSTAYNVAHADARQAEALLKISEGKVLAFQDELGTISGACP